MSFNDYFLYMYVPYFFKKGGNSLFFSILNFIIEEVEQIQLAT